MVSGKVTKVSRKLEVARRADILRRYTSIKQPTVIDDEQHAAELGLKVKSLYRLAKLWRTHGDPSALDGARLATADADVHTAVDAARSPDLAGVTPSRRPEIRRRIGVLRDYLLAGDTSDEAVAAAAAALGLTSPSFRRLLRSWLLHQDPAALPGATLPHTINRRKHPTVSAEVERIVAAAIQELGTGARSLAVHRRVIELCELEGLRPPGPTTVYYRLMKARSAKKDEAQRSFWIDHFAIALAVEGRAGVQMPVLSLLFERPTGYIVAHRLSLTPPSAHAASLLVSMATRALPQDPAAVSLHLSTPPGADWDGLVRILKERGVSVVTPAVRRLRAGAYAGQAFGDILGTLRIRPGYTQRPTGAQLRRAPSMSDPLSFAEASAAVADVIRNHNRGREKPTWSFVASSQLEALQAALRNAPDQ